MITLLVGFGMYTLFRPSSTNAPSQQNQNPTYSTQDQNPSQAPTVSQKSGELKNFTPEEFKNTYNNFAYPNAKVIDESTPITGNFQADEKIRTLAEARGYQLRMAPVNEIFTTVQKNMLLQKRAASDWQSLTNEASKQNIKLTLTAAYRSADEQKSIFMSRMLQTGVNIDQIPAGTYDEQINKVLETTAVPGYSRHHSGYTVDIGCKNQPSLTFETTICFDWLKAENYRNAKTFGWIPSYPEGADKQGPEPEAWEYVWVGREVLLK